MNTDAITTTGTATTTTPNTESTSATTLGVVPFDSDHFAPSTGQDTPMLATRSPRSSTRTLALRSALAVGVLTFTATGCGAIVEKATEKAVEQVVENETGENVDINFDDDGIQINSDSGNVSINADENGVQIEGSDGQGGDFSLESDADGNFTATDGDGNVATGQVDSDGDGSFTINGENGDSVFTSGAGIPDQWPSDIPEPTGLDDTQGTYAADAGSETFIVVGTTNRSVGDTYDTYVSDLTGAGFTEQSKFTDGDNLISATFTKDDRTVNVSAQSDGTSTQLVVSVN